MAVALMLKVVKYVCVCAVVLVLFFQACVGGSDRPCHGNGMCDGDGTRGGNGKCGCAHGYKGEFCLDCIDGFFGEVRNDTFSLCTGKRTQTERAAAVASPAFSATRPLPSQCTHGKQRVVHLMLF